MSFGNYCDMLCKPLVSEGEGVVNHLAFRVDSFGVQTASTLAKPVICLPDPISKALSAIISLVVRTIYFALAATCAILAIKILAITSIIWAPVAILYLAGEVDSLRKAINEIKQPS